MLEVPKPLFLAMNIPAISRTNTAATAAKAVKPLFFFFSM